MRGVAGFFIIYETNLRERCIRHNRICNGAFTVYYFSDCNFFFIVFCLRKMRNNEMVIKILYLRNILLDKWWLDVVKWWHTVGMLVALSGIRGVLVCSLVVLCGVSGVLVWNVGVLVWVSGVLVWNVGVLVWVSGVLVWKNDTFYSLKVSAE
ncbi:MAG: hypothetical protein PHE88_12030 [Elusimicrobia bacterium]|nr:hypothetical protein [Elusimicrobiota bacterium]